MHFDKLIQTVLEVLTPTLDGQREVYGARTTYDFLEKTGDYYSFHRYDEDEIEYFEYASASEEGVLYQGPSLTQALQFITDWQIRNEIVENTSGLSGTYYVLRAETTQQNDEDEIGVSRDEFCVFELSVSYQRQKEIQDDLKDVDITGYEDLL